MSTSNVPPRALVGESAPPQPIPNATIDPAANRRSVRSVATGNAPDELIVHDTSVHAAVHHRLVTRTCAFRHACTARYIPSTVLHASLHEHRPRSHATP